MEEAKEGEKLKKPKNFNVVVAALKNGNTRRAACRTAGIHYTTLYEWLKIPTLSYAIKKAEADAELEMVETVRKAAKRTWTAAAWWLERKVYRDWARKDQGSLVIKDWREAARRDGYDPDKLLDGIAAQFIAAMVAGTNGGSAGESEPPSWFDQPPKVAGLLPEQRNDP